MQAMILERLAPLRQDVPPLRLVEWPDPVAGPGELLVSIAACGVCHTELDEIEGRTPPPQLPVIPGHQVIGRVIALGPGVSGHQLGDRVGVGWIYSSSGDALENLSSKFVATGRDVHGGYAERMTVPQAYAYQIPQLWSDAEAAPLLCAGAVGYRALRLTQITDRGRLGFTGFGGSAHLVLQLVRSLYPRTSLYVFARHPAERQFALELGADWAGDTDERCPVPLDAVIDTTPAWKPVLGALANLRPGGRLVINAIRKEAGDQQELLHLSYHEHLWMERELKTVANVTQFDVREFLQLAATAGVRPVVQTYPLADANRALWELKNRQLRGAKVLLMQNPSAQ